MRTQLITLLFCLIIASSLNISLAQMLKDGQINSSTQITANPSLALEKYVWVPYSKLHILSSTKKRQHSRFDSISQDQLMDKSTEYDIDIEKIKKFNEDLDLEKLNGPFGGNVRRLAEFNDIFYAITDREIYYWQNEKWNSMYFDKVYCEFIRAIWVNNNGVIVGHSNGLLFQAVGGDQWERVVEGGTDFYNIVEIESGELLAATSKGILSISFDTKAEVSPYSLDDNIVYTISEDDQGYLWASTSVGLFKTKADEFDWIKVNIEPNHYKKILFDPNGIIYMIGDDKVFMSKDRGNTWDWMSGISFNDITLDSEGNLIVTDIHKLLEVDSQGVVWSSESIKYSLLTTLIQSEDSWLVGTHSTGATKYIPSKEFMAYFSEGMNSVTILGFMQMKNDELLAYSNDTIYVTPDNGLTWEAILGCWTRSVEQDGEGNIYIGLEGGIAKSIDFGRGWQQLNLSVYPYYIDEMAMSDDGQLICAATSNEKIYFSKDYGQSFELIKENFMWSNYQLEYIGDNDFLFSNGQLYYISDGGSNITELPDTLGYVTKILSDGLGNVFLQSWDGLYSSRDGASWEKIFPDTPHLNILEIDNKNRLFGYSPSKYFMISTDQGETWENVIRQSTTAQSFSFGLSSDGYGFLGAWGLGLYRKKIDLTPNGSDYRSMKISYKLSQNYPNPFNPTTKINYSIPKQSIVSIKVYDVLGREVTTLVMKEQQAGSYEVQFDASNLTSGIYFYKLKAGSFVESRKMVLLK